MVKTIVLTALGVALVVLALKAMMAGKKAKTNMDSTLPLRGQDGSPSGGLSDARVGDTLTLESAGRDFEDLDVTLDRCDRYEDGEHRWQEYRGRAGGRTVFIEVCDDDELEVSYSFPEEELSLSALGLSEDDLIQMDETQSHEMGFEHEGRRYHYDGSGEKFWFKDGQGAGEGFYAWDFKGEGPGENLTVEKWEGEPFKVTRAHPIAADKVRLWARS